LISQTQPHENHTVSWPKLLGSADTILANRKYGPELSCFFIVYGDNLTQFDLQKMLAFHRKHGQFLTWEPAVSMLRITGSLSFSLHLICSHASPWI